MALCISRKANESVFVGSSEIIVKQVRGGRVQLVIRADKSLNIRRGELKPRDTRAA